MECTAASLIIAANPRQHRDYSTLSKGTQLPSSFAKATAPGIIGSMVTHGHVGTRTAQELICVF